MPLDVSKSQAMVAAEAIPILQKLMKSCPPSFQERVEGLLNGLPGCLTVTIMRANNLRQVLGGTNAFCRLTIGHGPPRRTKVLNNFFFPNTATLSLLCLYDVDEYQVLIILVVCTRRFHVLRLDIR